MRKWSLNRLFTPKMIDIPPVWLLGFILLAYWQSRALDLGLSFGAPWLGDIGGILIALGLLLMLLAVFEMRKLRTTVIPHQEASHLVTSGIFRWSRNPIYLGDVLVLLGLILRWDAVLSLPLVAIFLKILETRFIVPEEDALRHKFNAEFAQYCLKTRRFF